MATKGSFRECLCAVLSYSYIKASETPLAGIAKIFDRAAPVAKPSAKKSETSDSLKNVQPTAKTGSTAKVSTGACAEIVAKVDTCKVANVTAEANVEVENAAVA